MVNNTNRQLPEEDTIDLLELLQILWKWAWLLVISALLAGSASYMATKFCVTPLYETEFTAYINNRNASSSVDLESLISSSSDLTASKSLAGTYAKVIVSREILLEAAEKAGYEDYTYKYLLEAVTASTKDDVEILSIKVKMESPKAAYDIATSLAEISGEYIGNIVEGSSMRIIDSPLMPESFCSPSYLKNTAVGGLFGAVLVYMLLVLVHFMDDTIKSEKELENRCGLTIIGTIPDLASAGKSGYGYGYYGYAGKKRKEK